LVRWPVEQVLNSGITLMDAAAGPIWLISMSTLCPPSQKTAQIRPHCVIFIATVKDLLGCQPVVSCDEMRLS